MIDQTSGQKQEKNHIGLMMWLLPVVAIVGHLPALGCWWNQDDWRLLAGAQGMGDTSWTSARVLSQVVYWKLFYPLFGMAVQPWAWTRLLLHGLNALMVYRIGLRLDLKPMAAWIGGLLFAVSPLAFTPLYWASGIQELLGAAFALLAVDQLLRNTPRSILAAALLTALSIFAKESALLLPLFFGIIVIYSHHKHMALRLVFAVFLLALAIWEGSLVLVDLAHVDVASPVTYITNIMLYAWWMFTPWFTFTSGFTLLGGIAGLAIWSLWIALAWRSWRRGDRSVTALLIGSLLALAAAAMPETQTKPYLAYLAWSGGALLIGKLLFDLPPLRALNIRTTALLLLAMVMTATTWFGMEHRLQKRDAQGNPADPLVLSTSLSHQALRILKAAPMQPDGRTVLLQIPARNSRVRDDLPDNTRLYQALGGPYGLALNGLDIQWTKTLFNLPVDAVVMADASNFLSASPLPRHWGLAHQAYIYLSLSLIGEGRHTEARNVLLTGLQRDREVMSFIFDPDQLPVPLDAVRENAPHFLALIPTAALSDEHRDALLEFSAELFSTCEILN
jgi:hypothetical protein